MKKKIAVLILAATAGFTIHNANTSKAYADEVNNVANTTENENTQVNSSRSIKKGQVINVTSNLRIRSRASTDSSIIGNLKPSAIVNIEGQTGSWYKIEFNGTRGYVHGDYLKVISTGDSNSSGSGNSGNSNSGQSQNKTAQVINVTSNLRIRKSESTSSSIVGYLYPNEKFTVIGENGSWYKLNKNGAVGYVHKDYAKIISTGSGSTTPPITAPENKPTTPEVTPESSKGQVVNVTSNLRVRSSPSTSASIVGYLVQGNQVDIIGKSGSWYYINFSGKKGYVHGDYIKKIDNNSNNNNSNNNNGQTSSKYQEVFNIMNKQVGTPYIYGGSGEEITTQSLESLKKRFPSNASRGDYNINSKYINSGYRAFDCSGLMQWGFKQAGINLGRTTHDQIKNGVEVSPSNAQPGDLLFFTDLGHVGMYIGNNQWIESPKPGVSVRVTNVPWNLIGRARRVL